MATRRRTAAAGAAPIILILCGAALATSLLASGVRLPSEVGLTDEEIEQYNSMPASFVEGAKREQRYPKYMSKIAVPSDSRDRLLLQLQKELGVPRNGGNGNLSSMLQRTELGSKLSKSEEALLKAATPGYRGPGGGTSEDEEEDDFADFTGDHASSLVGIHEFEDDLDDNEGESSDEASEGSFFENVETQKKATGRPEKNKVSLHVNEKLGESANADKDDDDLAVLEEDVQPMSLEEEDEEEEEEDEDPEAFLEEEEEDEESDDEESDDEELDPRFATHHGLYDPYAADVAARPSALQESSVEKETGDGEGRADTNIGGQAAAAEEEESRNSHLDEEGIISFIEVIPLQQSIRAHFRTATPRHADSRSSAAVARDNFPPHDNLNSRHRSEAATRPASFSQEKNHELADQGSVEEELLREAEEGGEDKSSFEDSAEAPDVVGAEDFAPATTDAPEQMEPPLVEPPADMRGSDALASAAPETSDLVPAPEEAAGLGTAPAEAGTLAEQMEAEGKRQAMDIAPPATAAAPEAEVEGSAGGAGLEARPPLTRPPLSDEDAVLGPVGVGESAPVEPAGASDEYFPPDSLNLQGTKLREPAEDILHRHGWDDMKLTQGLLMDRIKLHASALGLSTGWIYGAATVTAIAAAFL